MRNFLKKVEGSTEYQGQIPEMDKFIEFWGSIWEKEESTPEMPWMDKVHEQLTEKVNSVKEFNITDKSLVTEIKKRKNWTAPGIDGIQTFWWKRFKPAIRALKIAF